MKLRNSQPIASAPRDGTVIAVCDGEFAAIVRWRVGDAMWRPHPEGTFLPWAHADWEHLDTPQGSVDGWVNFAPTEWAPVVEDDEPPAP